MSRVVHSPGCNRSASAQRFHTSVIAQPASMSTASVPPGSRWRWKRLSDSRSSARVPFRPNVPHETIVR